MFITKHAKRAGLLTLLAAAALPALAQPVTVPADGDIFLGFRAGGGQGSGVSLLVNVGNDLTFRNATPGSTLNLNALGDIGADLTATFGANWHARSDLSWGFFGARNNANPPVYASRAQNPAGTPAPDYNALATSARTATKNKIISVTTAYQGLEATANSSKAGLQNNALNDGSYNFQVTGGTTSFGTLSQWTNIEDSFGAGAAGTALDLFRLAGTTQKGDTVTRLGTFSISSSGALSFTAAPLLNQVTFGSIAYQAQEDAGNVVIVIERTGDISGTASATFQIASDTAVAGTDFTLPDAFTVNFAANVATASFTIPVINRPGHFGSRSFTASLVSASDGFQVRAPSTATVTITDIDPASTLNFASASLQIQQFSSGSTPNTAVLTINREGITTGSVSIQVSVTGGSLSAGTHFTFSSPQTVTFLSQETSKNVNVPLTSGIIPGTILFSLSNPGGSTVVGTAGTATVQVVPNAGDIAFTTATFSTSTASSSVNLTLTRTNGSSGAVSVEVSASGGSLVNGTDYTFASPTVVNFANGATSASATVQLNTTTPGSIVLSLANPTGSASIGAQSSTTIQVAGAPGSIAFGAVRVFVVEESGVASIPLVRTGGSSGTVTVSVNSSNGSAVAPADYTALSNFLVTFAEGVTTAQVPVAILLDTVKNEPNETFTLTLSSPGGGAVLGGITTTTVTILDVDSAAPVVAVTSPKNGARIPEAGDAQVAVTGAAKDNKAVAKVEVQINGSEFVEAALAEGAKGAVTFAVNVAAERGTNTLTVRSTDFRGNTSEPVTVTFVYDDPYPSIAGIYTGLATVQAPSPASNGTEGRIVITVTAKGTFSGKLDLDGLTFSFTGSIASSGDGLFGKSLNPTLALPRKGKSSLALSLQFDLAKTGNSHRVTGSVSDGEVVSTLEADRLLYTSKPNPASPFANPSPGLIGAYTVLFEAVAPSSQGLDPSAYPQGDGWAAVNVSSAGIVKITGALADGSTLTFSGPLSAANRLPFFVTLYKKLGSVSGPVKFESLAQTDADGADLFWFRPADSKSKLYPAGWGAGITTDLSGSKFVKVAKGDTVSTLGFVGDGIFSLSDGALATPLSRNFSIAADNKVTTSDKTFSVAVAGTTGIVSGSFTPDGEKRKPAYKGAVLQKSGKISGFFLGLSSPAQSGKAAITPAP